MGTRIGKLPKFEYLCAQVREQIDTNTTVRIPAPLGTGQYQLAPDEALFVFTPHQQGSLYFAVVADDNTSVAIGQNLMPLPVSFNITPNGSGGMPFAKIISFSGCTRLHLPCLYDVVGRAAKPMGKSSRFSCDGQCCEEWFAEFVFYFRTARTGYDSTFSIVRVAAWRRRHCPSVLGRCSAFGRYQSAGRNSADARRQSDWLAGHIAAIFRYAFLALWLAKKLRPFSAR